MTSNYNKTIMVKIESVYSLYYTEFQFLCLSIFTLNQCLFLIIIFCVKTYMILNDFRPESEFLSRHCNLLYPNNLDKLKISYRRWKHWEIFYFPNTYRVDNLDSCENVLFDKTVKRLLLKSLNQKKFNDKSTIYIKLYFFTYNLVSDLRWFSLSALIVMISFTSKYLQNPPIQYYNMEL